MKKLKTATAFLLIFTLIAVFIIPVSAKNGSYTVQQGDTMWKIAKRYNVSPKELIKANPQVDNPSLIFPGQSIYLPETDDITELENEVINSVNRLRVKSGLSPLKQNLTLCKAARAKSTDMIESDYFAHQSPTLGSPFTMMQSFGIVFSAAGENIAHGQTGADEVMEDWMNSPGHKANIMSDIYNQIGVGVAKADNGTYYFTQLFIKSI
ncbi:MAG: SafA/ExsA family spore coat assembly protein [Clostridia bacterium]|nr:SafA/ExsA family spore coat assembly protein [Clostridia bacterium]